MQVSTRDSARSISRYRIAAVLAFFALNLGVYLIRIVSVWRYGTLFCVSGVETPMIESVWKSMHHLPVYASPFSYPFSLSLYNYLFYSTYAGVLRFIGAWDAGILTLGRQFTLLFALTGAMAQWRLVRGWLGLRGLRGALSLALAVGLWLSTSLIKYWALTIRPDMAAAALVMIALWVVVRQPRFCFAYAGVLLYLAWAFKQSVILAFLGLCLWLIVEKNWRNLAVLASVFALPVAITLGLGTPDYRFSILVAPQMVKGFHFGYPWLLHALGTGLSAAGLNLYWVAAPFVLLRAAGSAHQDDKKVRMVATVFALALTLGIVGMGKVGGTSNYLFEAFAAGSTLLQLAVFTLPGRLVTALVFFGCVQPAVQIAGAAVGYHHPGKRDMAAIATASEYRDAEALRACLEALPKPIFTTDGIFSLPWIANNNESPAITLDPNFQQIAQAHDQNGGVEGMLQRGQIPTVMLAATDVDYIPSLNPGYKKIGESFQQGVAYSIYEFQAEAPHGP